MNDIAKKWHLLSPDDYTKVFDFLSTKYPKFFIKKEIFVLQLVASF
jgi:hypothetical protein